MQSVSESFKNYAIKPEFADEFMYASEINFLQIKSIIPDSFEYGFDILGSGKILNKNIIWNKNGGVEPISPVFTKL